MQIDVHVHLHSTGNGGVSSELEGKIDKLLVNQETIMARVDDLKAELVAANEATNEIASDVDDLAKRLASGVLTEAETSEVQAELVALKTRLQSVAAVHTPSSPA